MDKLLEISTSLQNLRRKQVVKLVNEAIEEGVSASDILNNGLLHGMNVIGEQFKNEEVFVPEVLIAARCMSEGIELLRPHLQEGDVNKLGKAVIGTVKGDKHDIGKNLVKIMLEGKGIEVIDLGIDVPAETFISSAKENNVDIICCSSLLTTTMGEMERVVKLVKEENLDVKVMIGGAPVNQQFCDAIGADYYTDDAATASDVAKAILEGKA